MYYLSFTPILYHKYVVLSRGFRKIFATIFLISDTFLPKSFVSVLLLYTKFPISITCKLISPHEVPLLTLLLYHKSGKMSSGNFAQSFSGKMARSVQNAQIGTRRPGSFRWSFRQKRKSPELIKSPGFLLRGLMRGKSDLARTPSSVSLMAEVFQHVLRIILIFILTHNYNFIFPFSRNA